MLRTVSLVLTVAAAAGAADPTLGIRYADAIASLAPPFAMRRTVRDGETVYAGTAGTAVLTMHLHGDLVRKAELETEDVAVPDAGTTGGTYLRNFTIRGRFITSVLPSWHAAALAWTDETIHALSPAAIAGRPQSRTTARAGTELRLDLAAAGTRNGRALLRLALTAQPESRTRR